MNSEGLPEPTWAAGEPVSERGALDAVDAAKVARATQSVRLGKVVGLSHPLDYPPVPPGGRSRLRRTAWQRNELRELGAGRYVVQNDDTVEFALQGSSHWDTFAHCGLIEPTREGVFYGGHGLAETADGASPLLGIDRLLPGIVTRGVLIDAVEPYARSGEPYLASDLRISAEMIAHCLEQQGVSLEAGDVACIFTGFEARLRELGDQPLPREIAGLSSDTLSLWASHKVAALVSDNTAVEASPVDFGIHIGALRNLGILLGELWALEEAARMCRQLGVYEFLVVSVPLRISGAFGSPANAVAVF